MRRSFQDNQPGPARRSPDKRHRDEDGFTLVELLVVIAVIALLMAILLPALTKAREQGKRAVCLIQIKQLQLAWNMYCETNAGKMPSSDIYYNWAATTSVGAKASQCRGWYEWPHDWPHARVVPCTPDGKSVMYDHARSWGCVESGTCDKDDWQHSIAEGALWKYIEDYKVYGCPVGMKGEYVTYTMVHSMNAFPDVDGVDKTKVMSNVNSIKRTSERIAFLDEGRSGQGAYLVNYYHGQWMDAPAMRHGKGTNYSFLDGHSEYRKWTDLHTLDWDPANKYGFAAQNPKPPLTKVDDCDCDLRWLCKGAWGIVGYSCNNPSKHCDE